VDNQIQQWAKDHGFEGLDLKAETEKFLDWHRAKGSLFKDWNAAWRSWIRKAAEFNPNAVKSVTPAVSVNERQKREVRLRLEGNLRAARLSDDRDAIDEMEARLEALA
jgi:epoxyqueuosine reductase QueG